MPGELLGGEERLRQEPFEPPGPEDRLLILLRQFLQSEHRDDVLEILVLRERRADRLGDAVMPLACDLRGEHAGLRLKRLDGRIKALAGPFSRQYDGRGQVPERVDGRRVGEIIRRHVDRLDRRDCARRRAANPLFEFRQLGLQRRLVADPRGQPTQQARDFRSRLNEAEDVVHEQQHVLPGLVTEILGHGQGDVPDAEPHARLLVHLPEDEHGVVQHAYLLDLPVQFLTFP